MRLIGAIALFAKVKWGHRVIKWGKVRTDDLSPCYLFSLCSNKLLILLGRQCEVKRN